MSADTKLIQHTDQCVMCGLCLPSCPTYVVSQQEGESPRGRISLIKAFAENNLQASAGLETHLQSCTSCLRCQTVCPANVNYQEILDQGRNLYRKQLSWPIRFTQRISLDLLTHSWGHKLVRSARYFRALLPKQYKSKLNVAQALDLTDLKDNTTTSVTLFIGCTGNLFDTETLQSILQVFTRLNINANISTRTLCCGALAQHSGFPERAKQQIKKLSEYLSPSSKHDLISFASGCGQQLKQVSGSHNFEHYDIHSWLDTHDRLAKLSLNPFPKKVLLHLPCSLTNTEREATYNVISSIPQIEVIQFDDNISCCGAGGMQLLTPQASNQKLQKLKVENIEKQMPDLVVSANIGCSLHLQAGLKQNGLGIEVIHPVTLLARQLKAS